MVSKLDTFHCWDHLVDELKINVLANCLTFGVITRQYDHQERNPLSTFLRTGNRKLVALAMEVYYGVNTFFILAPDTHWSHDYLATYYMTHDYMRMTHPGREVCGLIRNLTLSIDSDTAESMTELCCPGVKGWRYFSRPKQSQSSDTTAWQAHFNNLRRLRLIITLHDSVYHGPYHRTCPDHYTRVEPCCGKTVSWALRKALGGFETGLQADIVEVKVSIEGCRVPCVVPSINPDFLIQNDGRPPCGCEEEVEEIIKAMVKRKP
ncbi:hypothetical protein BDV95DRAFT_603116 [Massariosphaeria phaeospora]|uniref:Uncharacterized protein n=1 Tax=Massariosphaeria phaeospora TaxID=100035 RepID=A0A7C8ILG3_9PLEO|nr:hypothetical protein BDV95DRAFT_603116 [Massariosphaeria phaeospora]